MVAQLILLLAGMGTASFSCPCPHGRVQVKTFLSSPNGGSYLEVMA